MFRYVGKVIKDDDDDHGTQHGRVEGEEGAWCGAVWSIRGLGAAGEGACSRHTYDLQQGLAPHGAPLDPLKAPSEHGLLVLQVGACV
jgi:hypothetical protein